jgi:hypothetical protein
MDAEEKKDMGLLVALAVTGVILMLLALAVGPLMMRRRWIVATPRDFRV